MITGIRRQKEKRSRKKGTRIHKQLVDIWMVGWVDEQTDTFVFWDGVRDSMDMSLSKLWEVVKDRNLICCSPWVHKSQTQLSE